MGEHGTSGPGNRAGEAVELGVGELSAAERLAIAIEEAPEQLPEPQLPPAADEGGVLRRAMAWRELAHTPYGMKPAVVLGLITFFQVLDTFGFQIAAPDVARDLEINVGTIIGVLQIVAIVSIFAAIFAGWYADRHRRVPFVTIGTITSGVFSMLTGGAGSSLTLGAARVGDQVSDEASGVPRFALIADYYPPEARGRAFALLGMLGNGATVLAPLTAGILVVTVGWRAGFVILGVPLVLMGIAATLTLREPIRGYMERKALGSDEATARVEDEPLSFGESWRTVWAVRTVRRVVTGAIFTSAASSAAGLFFVFFLAEAYGLDAWARAWVFTPAVVASVLGNFLGGGLVDVFVRRHPGRVLLVVGAFPLVAAVGVLGYASQPPLGLIIAFAVLTAFGGALVGPATGAIYSQVIPPTVRVMGIQMTGLAALPGLVVGLQVASMLHFEYGYPAVFLFCAPMFLVGGLIQMTAAGFFELDMRNAFATALAGEEWRKAKREGKGKLLVCRDVDVEYDGVQVLFGVDFDVEEGEIVALLGTNGAGKSTLLRAISGTQEASAGAIVFDGRDITHMPPHEVTARGVIHMPGGRGVFPGLTVRENLLLGTWVTHDAPDLTERVAEVLEVFPILRERAGELAGDLSGGEQQMLSLAQAFLAKPRLLMIDELSLGLSPAVVGQLLEVVREINRRGVTVVVVEQSVNVALNLAEKAIFMEKGEVRFFGKTADLLARPDILRAVYVKGTGALTSGPAAAGPAAARRRHELEVARPVLEVHDLHKRFGGVTAVAGVSFALREGEVLGLIGPNGAGKTTLFDLISGYQQPDEGRVVLEGVDITRAGPEERSKQGLVRRFQDARLFPSLTVTETLLVALEQHLEVRSTVLTAAQVPRARRAERRLRVRADRLIELFELGAFRDKYVRELSTGLRRIVDVACVLAAEPRVLLLDEPSSGIAQAEAEGLAPLLRRVRHETGCSLLIIEHDMPLISAVSDELIALDQGAVVVRGRPDDVLDDERVIESYLGGSEAAVKRSGSLT